MENKTQDIKQNKTNRQQSRFFVYFAKEIFEKVLTNLSNMCMIENVQSEIFFSQSAKFFKDQHITPDKGLAEKRKRYKKLIILFFVAFFISLLFSFHLRR